MPTMTARKKELMTAVLRKRTFECATALLKDAGWENFTMEKLARAVGVSKGTLYNYFYDKRDVVCFIRNCLIENLSEQIVQGLEKTDDPRRFLRDFVISTLEHAKEYRFLAMAFLDLALARDRKILVKSDMAFSPERSVSVVLQRCMESGVVRKGDAMLMAIVLNAVLAVVELSCELVYDYDLSSPEVMEQIADWLLNGILTESKEEG